MSRAAVSKGRGVIGIIKGRVIWYLIPVVLVFLLVGGYFLLGGIFKGDEQGVISSEGVLPPASPEVSLPLGQPAFMEQGGGVDSYREGDEELYSLFAVDRRGNLVTDVQARLSIEQLTALNTPEQLRMKLERLAVILPPRAYSQLVHLIDSYNRYIAAVKEVYPPGKELTTVEEAVAQLEGLHALRVRYFGARVAEAFYGAEERHARKLFELMAMEADDSLTLEQKAEKALMMMQQNPELAPPKEEPRGDQPATR